MLLAVRPPPIRTRPIIHASVFFRSAKILFRLPVERRRNNKPKAFRSPGVRKACFWQWRHTNSDASAKGLNVVDTIRRVADDAVDYEKAGLILNRLRGKEERAKLAIPPGLDCLGWVPEDETIRAFDIEGRSLLDAPDSPAIEAARNCLASMGLV